MQSLATGLDEEYKRPKNLTDQVVRLLDDDAVTFPDRLRLIIEYILYRDGVFASDLEKLLAHAQLPAQDGEIVQNMDILGARTSRQLKDTKPPSQPLFGKKQPPNTGTEELSISRFEPAIKSLLEEQLNGSLDQNTFPYTKPFLDANEGAGLASISQSSLRSAKPTWARTRPSAMEPRQRIIVFMAGGATYSESRSCYKISRTFAKDIYLATSHMLNPSLFLRQVGELSVDRRRLDLPADHPKPKAPAHLFEKEPAQSQTTLQPPVAGLGAMTLNSGGNTTSTNGAGKPTAKSHPLPSPTFASAPSEKHPKAKKRGFFKF